MKKLQTKQKRKKKEHEKSHICYIRDPVKSMKSDCHHSWMKFILHFHFERILQLNWNEQCWNRCELYSKYDHNIQCTKQLYPLPNTINFYKDKFKRIEFCFVSSRLYWIDLYHLHLFNEWPQISGFYFSINDMKLNVWKPLIAIGTLPRIGWLGPWALHVRGLPGHSRSGGF